MSFGNLIFNHTRGLGQYSDQITNALTNLIHNHGYIIQRNSIIQSSLLNEDELDYWGPGSCDITFGRHLEFTSPTVINPIRFWIGMDMPIRNIRFLLWFQHSSFSNVQINNLQALVGHHFVGMHFNNIPPDNEIFFALNANEFSNFCNTLNTNDIEGFLHEIFTVL